jgi:glycine cleavage system aminomethyltransferase T
VTVGGRDVGRVTTAAVSPRLGPIALAYVHRDHFGAGTVVEAGGARATVVASFDDAGARG